MYGRPHVVLLSLLPASARRAPTFAPFLLLLFLASAVRGIAGQPIFFLDRVSPPGAANSSTPITSPLIQKEIRLAVNYLTGRGVQKDAVQAAYWFRKAADQGDPEAQNEIGYLYLWGIGVPRDEAESFRWFARATGGGSQPAKLNLAVAYMKGVGTPRDLPLALELMNQLAAKGNARAQGYLGIAYLAGTGVPKDPGLAEKWLKKAAKGKNPEAEYALGILWSNIAAHPHDPAKAVSYQRAAARDGYVPAMHALGLLLEQHPEIEARPSNEAVMMLERAAQAGSWASSVALGTLARDGRDRPVSLAEAFRWFTIATKQGGAAAQQLTRLDLDRCRHTLSEEQQNRELAAAAAWLEQHPHTSLYIFRQSDAANAAIGEVYAETPAGQ